MRNKHSKLAVRIVSWKKFPSRLFVGDSELIFAVTRHLLPVTVALDCVLAPVLGYRWLVTPPVLIAATGFCQWRCRRPGQALLLQVGYLALVQVLTVNLFTGNLSCK